MDNFLFLLKIFGFVFKLLGFLLLSLVAVWILVAFLGAMVSEAIGDIKAKLGEAIHK